MAIIIADIHGCVEKAKAFLEYKPAKEHVALGDYVDNIVKGITLDDELACLDLLLASDAVLLYGNHDLAYTEEFPWPDQSNHTAARNLFLERFRPHKQRMKAAYSVGGWLCTHAGVSPGVAAIIPADVISDGSVAIASWINDEFQREMTIQVPGTDHHGYGPLFQIDISRFGTHQFGGIFWYDVKREGTNPSPLVGQQIFGHTPVPAPNSGTGAGVKWINLNNDGAEIWVYDTELNRLVRL